MAFRLGALANQFANHGIKNTMRPSSAIRPAAPARAPYFFSPSGAVRTSQHGIIAKTPAVDSTEFVEASFGE